MTNNKRALIIATVPGFFVHMDTVRNVLVKLGFSVEAASNFDGCVSEEFSEYAKCYDITFTRSPFSRDNVHAYHQLRNLFQKEHYDLVICNTPVGGVIGRLAATKARLDGAIIIYMAHGFHFYSGAPLSNWLLYYPIEWACSWITDILITITKEDYERARKHLHADKTVYVPGVGVDLLRFRDAVGEYGVREELGIPHDASLILSVGELNRNKNHEIVVRALRYLSANVHYVVAGEGNQATALNKLAKELGVQERVHLLGRRGDVPRLMADADLYVLPSLREGLNVSLMEAMASGLPCVCRRVRGNVDLITDGVGGQLVNKETDEKWAEAINRALCMNREAVKIHNQAAVNRFSYEAVMGSLNGLLGEIG